MNPVDGSARRVVIADDDLPVRALLRHTLARDARFVVVGEAGDGSEALEVVAETDPDLLLLDLVMPEMDGLAVLHALGSTSRPTVVVLTGIDDDLEDQALSGGAAAYLEKGSAFDALTDRLAQVLGDQETTIEVPTRDTVSPRPSASN